MAHKQGLAATAVLCALLLGVTPVRPLLAQAKGKPVTTQSTLYSMQFNNATQSVDATGRVVLVGLVTGSLPGVLTLAFHVDPSGNITDGEFALNVSYTQYGAPDPDGDGDPSEVLIQRGVIKGAIGAGAAGMNPDGTALNINGLRLKIHSATVEFANVTAGTGSFDGASLTAPLASNGAFTLNF